MLGVNNMKEVSLKELLEAGCHFGHQTTRWNPKMKQYIFTSRDKIHIFDLVKTKQGLQKAGEFIKESVSRGEQIILVGTKRQAQDIVKAAAEKAIVPYMTRRWIGGLLTNWDMMKKRLDYLKSLKTGKIEGKFKTRTKKENLLIDRQITKMEMDFGGVVGLEKVPEIVFVVDARKDIAAVREGKARGAKVVAIVDTNSNPDLVDFVIPANDDATRSIQLIVDHIVEAIEEGRKEWGIKKEKEDKEKQKAIEKSEKQEEKKSGNSEQSKGKDDKMTLLRPAKDVTSEGQAGSREQLKGKDDKVKGSREQSGKKAKLKKEVKIKEAKKENK